MRHALLVPVAAALALSIASAEVETFECDEVGQFALTNFTDAPPAGATLAAEEGALVLRQDRASLAALHLPALMTEATELRLSIESKAAVTLGLIVPDRDGARWIQFLPLPAGKRTELRARVDAFELTDDSPVKKARIEPSRLGFACFLFDVGVVQGAKGANEIRVHGVEVERAPLDVFDGDLVVDSAVEVKASTLRRGNVHVKKGGALRVTAPRFVLEGNLLIEGGSVEIEGGVYLQPQQFNHQRRIDLKDGGRLHLSRVLEISWFPLALEVPDGTEYVTEGTHQVGGMTASVGATARVTCTGGSGLNEFVLSPGAKAEFRGCGFLILWFFLGENLLGNARFPKCGRVDSWKASAGHDVTVDDCERVLFCIVSNAGSKGSIVDGDLYGAGLFFSGSEPVTLVGLKNKERVEDLALEAPDRDLWFKRTTVAAWNVYPALSARVSVRDCVFGETLAFHDAKEEIIDSTCDGTGGYFGAQDRASIHAKRCTITCLVVARDQSTIVLEDCEVVGEVRAAGTSTIKLIRCKVKGRIVREPGAKVVEE
ncbi:MAG: hypothetical protein AAB434_10930 [Planctomycetota bacterium]